MKTKSITIREDQANWIKKNHFTLSPFVQDILDVYIDSHPEVKK